MLAIASRAAAYTTPAVMMALRRALASLSMVCDLSGRVIMAATSVLERLTPADMGGRLPTGVRHRAPRGKRAKLRGFATPGSGGAHLREMTNQPGVAIAHWRATEWKVRTRNLGRARRVR